MENEIPLVAGLSQVSKGVVVLFIAFWVRKTFCDSGEQVAGSRYLIVNADDLGLSEGVTQGIVKAWHEGILTSTTAMINIKGAPQQVTATHARYPDLPIGLHLNITTGRPVLAPEDVPTLVDKGGCFYTSGSIIEHLHEVSLDELRAELGAQAKLMIARGVRFDHIDYHQHMVALYTPFYQVVCELAKEYAVPVRHPVPESLYGNTKLQGRGGSAEAMKRMIQFGIRHPVLAMRLMPKMTPNAYRRYAALLDAQGIGTPNWFIDSYYGNPSRESLIVMLAQLPPGVSELMVHPAIVDDSLRRLGGTYVEQREAELAVLLDPRVREAVAQYQVKLVDYSFVKPGRYLSGR